jgi:hypothetical protein
MPTSKKGAGSEAEQNDMGGRTVAVRWARATTLLCAQRVLRGSRREAMAEVRKVKQVSTHEHEHLDCPLDRADLRPFRHPMRSRELVCRSTRKRRARPCSLRSAIHDRVWGTHSWKMMSLRSPAPSCAPRRPTRKAATTQTLLFAPLRAALPRRLPLHIRETDRLWQVLLQPQRDIN